MRCRGPLGTREKVIKTSEEEDGVGMEGGREAGQDEKSGRTGR